MNSANVFCYVPRTKEQKVAYVEQVREKVTENVVKISFENLKTHLDSFTNEPTLFCASCQASLNSLSIVSKDADVSVWSCEFCSYTNRIDIPFEKIIVPKNSDVCYMLKQNEKVMNNNLIHLQLTHSTIISETFLARAEKQWYINWRRRRWGGSERQANSDLLLGQFWVDEQWHSL